MPVADARTRCLNFVVTGNVRSGAYVLQTTISNRTGAICHGNLLHPDKDIRREAHESYFGVGTPGKIPEWFNAEISPWHYLSHTVFDNPRAGEHSIGIRLSYSDIETWELCELVERRCREGDFCLIHVRRNPIACFVSLKQAEASKRWCRSLNDRRTSYVGAIVADPAELVEFCRKHMAMERRISAACDDRLDVEYGDLVFDFQRTMRRVLDFVELPCDPPLITPGCLRIRINRDMPDRLMNAKELRKKLPSDVAALLDASNFM